MSRHQQTQLILFRSSIFSASDASFYAVIGDILVSYPLSLNLATTLLYSQGLRSYVLRLGIWGFKVSGHCYIQGIKNGESLVSAITNINMPTEIVLI